MREITSVDNKICKLVRELDRKKYRDKYARFIIEGDNLIEEAVKNGADVETVLIRQGYRGRLYGMEDITYVLPEKLFAKLCLTETSQGIIAIVKKKEISQTHILNGNVSGNFVILDRLQDPGNIGTILRTADAAGYRLAIVMKGTADIYSPKVVRAATGSGFRMPVVFMDSVPELAEFTRATGKKLVATSLKATSYYYEEDLTDNIALIIGNEGNGISQELLDCSDINIKIPMHGTIESLNASVAAAILMYESVRGKGFENKQE